MDLTNQFVTYGGIILAIVGLIYAQVTYINIRSMHTIVKVKDHNL